MSECHAPIRDMLLVLNELAILDEIAQIPGCEEASADVVSAFWKKPADLPRRTMVLSACSS